MALDDMIGGSMNRCGGIDGADYRPTGFSMGTGGSVFSGYQQVARFDAEGNLRSGYDSLTGIRFNPISGLIERDPRG